MSFLFGFEIILSHPFVFEYFKIKHKQK